MHDSIRRAATNARITLTDEEVEKFAVQAEDILKAFAGLKSLDTRGEEPSVQPIPCENMLREDLPRECLTQDEALANTPHKKDGYFKGPKVM